MKSILFLIPLIYFTLNALSQDFSLPHKFCSVDEIINLKQNCNVTFNDELELLDEKVVEFAHDENQNLFEFFYLHSVTLVNSEEAISRNNKIYIPVKNIDDVIDMDCRVVLSNGEIIQLEKSTVKQAVNDKGQNVFFFAVSGAEKGSYIDYYYLIKREANISGSYFNMQRDYPIAKSVFRIISPKHIYFTTKSYNGYSSFETDTSLIEKNGLIAKTSNIPKVTYADFANPGANKMKIEYHLYNNTDNGIRNYYNYGRASQSVYENLAGTISKTAVTELEKILKKCDAAGAKTVTDKIFRIENFVKANFQYYNVSDDRLSDIDFILKNKAFNGLGGAKLFFNLFELSSIDNQIVLSSDRFENRFDPDYESWSFLQTYLFYFPEIDQYLSPEELNFRLGLIPYGFIGTYGLFIKKASVGGIVTGIGKIRKIPENSSILSQSNIILTAQINAELDSVDIFLTNTSTGYYGQPFQTAYDIIPEEKFVEFEENIVKYICDNISIKSIEVKNKGAENLMKNPFIVESHFTTNQVLDKAGSKLIFKIGELIGIQSELYQIEERILPVENEFNRSYKRELKFIIPDGYTVRNVEKINMTVQPFLESGDMAGFESSYTIDSKMLTINIYEYYIQLIIDKDQFELFRSVVNAAADFNKIVLILEPIVKVGL